MEPAFGLSQQGFGQILLRELERVAVERALVEIAYNLRRLHASWWLHPLLAP